MYMTLLVPYRNYDLRPFEIALKLLPRQTREWDEILVCDFSSDDPWATDMEKLCDEYGLTYYRTEIPDIHPDPKMMDKIISVHLWKTNYNIGIKKAKNDFVCVTGTDRVYEEEVCETIHNKLIDNKESMILTTAFTVKRLPDIEEFNDFEKLWMEAKSVGGPAMMGMSKKLWYEMRGFDETLRWYADNDMMRRVKQHGSSLKWTYTWRGDRAAVLRTQAKVRLPLNRVIHPRTHRLSRRIHGGKDVRNVAIRGKHAIGRGTGWNKPIRNEESWGEITEKNLNRALQLATNKLLIPLPPPRVE